MKGCPGVCAVICQPCCHTSPFHGTLCLRNGSHTAQSPLNAAGFYCQLHLGARREQKKLGGLRKTPAEAAWLPSDSSSSGGKQDSTKPVATSRSCCVCAKTECWTLSSLCTLHVQEHDVNNSVLQQETEDKTWWSFSSSWELTCHCFCLCCALKAKVTNTKKLFWQLQLYFYFPNSFRWLPVCLYFWILA